MAVLPGARLVLLHLAITVAASAHVPGRRAERGVPAGPATAVPGALGLPIDEAYSAAIVPELEHAVGCALSVREAGAALQDG